MLRPWDSQTPFAGVLREHECPRCHRAVELPLGAICQECRQEIERRSSRLAMIVAASSTLVMMVYVWWRRPQDPTARLVSWMSVGIWYLLTRLVVKRAARELMR